MRLDKLAVTAQEAFQNAMGVAGEADAAVIEPIHLLKALLDSDENNLAAIVKRIGADPVWLTRLPRCPSIPAPLPWPSLARTLSRSSTTR